MSQPLDPADRIAQAMAKTFWPFHWATLNDETQAQLIKYTRAVVEEIGPELAEVERLRGVVARQAEQITAIRALADDWRDFGDVTIHMDDAAADIDAALEPTS